MAAHRRLADGWLRSLLAVTWQVALDIAHLARLVLYCDPAVDLWARSGDLNSMTKAA